MSMSALHRSTLHCIRRDPSLRLRGVTRSRLRSSSKKDQGLRTSDGSISQVDRALLEAETAVETAQEAVQLVTKLPSAYPPHPVVELVRRSSSKILAGLMAGSMVFVLLCKTKWLRIAGAMMYPALVGFQALQRGYLSPSGALAAWIIGFGAFLGGFRCVVLVLSFFISSSILTKFKDQIKAGLNGDHKKGGQRDWIQVFSNGFIATVFCLLFAYSTGFRDSPLGMRNLSSLSLFLFGGVLGNYACTCGDTWASELGVLSKAPPRLITSLRPVHPGTNGGVTRTGLLASLNGGLFIGVSCFLASVLSTMGQPWTQVLQVAKAEWPVLVLGMIGGLFGSIIDSFLGATLQFSGFDRHLKKVVNRPSADPEAVYKINGIDLLSNNQVNLISSFLMSLVIGQMTVMIFG